MLLGGWNAVAQRTVDGQALPAFEIPLLNDSIVDSREFDGEVILLAFARTVLPARPDIACARSIGLLGLLEKEIITRFAGEEDLVVLPVIMHYKSLQEVTRFRDKYRLHFPMGLDKEKRVLSLFTGDDAPCLFVIDREGKITAHPITKEFSDDERARYKANTGKTLPASRVSLEPAARAIEEALAVVPAEKIAFRPLTLAGALERAREEGKPVLATCYLPWYDSCQYLLKRVFTRERVGAYCNARFVCVKFDMEEPEGARLQKRLDLPLTEPTTLLLAPDGSILHRVTGSAPAREWLAEIAKGVDTSR
jgi:peroxiredoxin